MSESSSTRSGIKRKRIRVTPGNEWSDNELNFFLIEIQEEKDFMSFFGRNPHRLEEFSEDVREILNIDLSNVSALRNIDWKSMNRKQVSRFVKQIFSVTKTHMNEESAVDDFARTVLECFNYDDDDLVIRSREELRLDMCGHRTSAKPDLCVETSVLTIKLLVQEDKSYQVSMDRTFSNTNPEAQVIAEAIAAFQENNKTLRRLRLPLKESQTIPCITMLGTYPTFYLFHVTQNLADAVKEGEEPENISVVKRYTIPITGLPLGDALLDNGIKHHAFQCYAALRDLIIQKEYE
jgi:hypothetical protein